MSNSQSMTLEEKLVQTIKTTQLASLVDDDDAITELTRRALKQALFDPITVGGPGYASKKEPSPVMKAARDLAEKSLEHVFKSEFQALLDDPAIRKVLQEAIISLLPDVLDKIQNNMMYALRVNNTMIARQNITEAFINKGLTPPHFSNPT